jgi:Uma2 family endonuclease
MREYVIVHQDRRRVELHRKNDKGKWQKAVLGERDQFVLESLPSGPLTLSMDDVYEDVILPAGETDDY